MHHEAPTTIRGAVGWTNVPDPGSDPGPGSALDRLVVPDGCMDIMWVAGELLVCGADTAARSVAPAPTTRLGIRFAPGHLPHLLGTPAGELVDQRVRLEDVLSSDAAPLAQTAERELREGRGSVQTLGDLAVRLGSHRIATELEDEIASLAGRGMAVAAMSDELGVGARRLHRRCVDAFGYGPKVLTRVLRFQRALALGRRGLGPAQVAAESGYADQPHLAREVRALTGTSWSALFPRGDRPDRPQSNGA